MDITLEYKSSRKEVWRWYWHKWRSWLWMVHCFFAIYIFFVAFTARSDGIVITPQRVMYAILATIAVEGLFVGFPQLMFKSQLRTITFNEVGISTKIGRKSGHVKWPAIRSIEDTNGEVIITRN